MGTNSRMFFTHTEVKIILFYYIWLHWEFIPVTSQELKNSNFNVFLWELIPVWLFPKPRYELIYFLIRGLIGNLFIPVTTLGKTIVVLCTSALTTAAE